MFHFPHPQRFAGFSTQSPKINGDLEVFVYLTLFTFVNSYIRKYKKNTKVPEKYPKPAGEVCGKDVENRVPYQIPDSIRCIYIVDYKRYIYVCVQGNSLLKHEWAPIIHCPGNRKIR
jgi:hypothetical protein